MMRRIIYLICLIVLSQTMLNAKESYYTEHKLKWSFDGHNFEYKFQLSRDQYKNYQKRSRYRDYDLFVTDKFDDYIISNLATYLRREIQKNKISMTRLPHFVIAFVQSLPYTVDSVTSGFDEYPRFPFETLYVGGGDCEDTAILTAAILHHMRYKAVLLKYFNHIAIGVYSQSAKGKYFKYNKQKYYYLETTGEGWEIGVVPDQYKKDKPEIIPIIPRPFIGVEFKTTYRYNSIEAFVDIDLLVTNLGSEIARDTKILVSLETRNSKETDTFTSQSFWLEQEKSKKIKTKTMKTSSQDSFRIKVVSTGRGFTSEPVYSEWIKFK